MNTEYNVNTMNLLVGNLLDGYTSFLDIEVWFTGYDYEDASVGESTGRMLIVSNVGNMDLAWLIHKLTKAGIFDS